MPKTIRSTGRADAIRAAVVLAVPGDIVLVAGKGHETYQEVKGVRHHFDDREELRKAFKIS
jgi:UDP-N-acetylmuramoyl-L-alanyl-D-glutamate--2,6-diaminopimelate ligase